MARPGDTEHERREWMLRMHADRFPGVPISQGVLNTGLEAMAMMADRERGLEELRAAWQASGPVPDEDPRTGPITDEMIGAMLERELSLRGHVEAGEYAYVLNGDYQVGAVLAVQAHLEDRAFQIVSKATGKVG